MKIPYHVWKWKVGFPEWKDGRRVSILIFPVGLKLRGVYSFLKYEVSYTYTKRDLGRFRRPPPPPPPHVGPVEVIKLRLNVFCTLVRWYNTSSYRRVSVPDFVKVSHELNDILLFSILRSHHKPLQGEKLRGYLLFSVERPLWSCRSKSVQRYGEDHGRVEN